MTTGLTTVRGARIAHETAGGGRDLVWGHGLAQSRGLESALPLIEWGRVPARVTRYDARGHGESQTTPDPEGYSWRSLALDQLELASRLGISTYVAAGASMGCGTALHAAVAAPERVERLVLVLPPTAWETRAAQASVWGQLAQILRDGGIEGLIAAQRAAGVPIPDAIADPDGYLAAGEAGMRTWDPRRLATVMLGAGRADLPPREEIAAFAAHATPTLILDWTGDPVHPTTTADELARLLPHAVRHTASTPDQLAAWTDRVAAFVAGP